MVGSSEEKPCLVVLDNVWSTEAWDILNNAVFSKLSDCTIMLTTRHKKVALRANPNSIIHPVRLRTEGQSWELFTQMVNCPSEAKDLAKEVVAGTGGLPLAILRLGYRLPKATTDELSRVLQRISHGQNQTPWLETSEKIEEKPIMAKCFSYFEFFPRDFTIPSRRLVALWVASKFFEVGEVGKESKQGGNLGEDEKKNCREEVAEEYLNKLIDCNMVQIVETKRNGEVKSCRFPSILGDIWVRGSPNKKTAHSWFLFLSSDRQLAYRFDDNDASNGRRIRGLEYSLDVSPEEKSPRSIMFFDSREGEKPGEEIGNFLLKGISSRRFHNLFVLDFEGVFRPNLPKSLGELKRLTYLGLRWTYLETLPQSIDNLSQLETLDLKHTYVRTLPISTWKLKKLRHLYLNQHCRVKLKPLPSTSSMKDLQTLCGVVVDHKASALTDGLEKLFSLRKLEVTILDSARQEGFLNKIKNLVQLTSLRLRSINKKGEAQVLKLGSLSQLKKLTSLYLLGKLENPSNCLSELPENLTELTLSATGLSEDPMNMLGSRLRGLKFLSFLAGSFVGTRMVCHGRDFPKLLVLRIWGLSTLEELEVHEGVMQRPWKFDKRNCQKLIIKTVETNNNEADHSDAIST